MLMSVACLVGVLALICAPGLIDECRLFGSVADENERGVRAPHREKRGQEFARLLGGDELPREQHDPGRGGETEPGAQGGGLRAGGGQLGIEQGVVHRVRGEEDFGGRDAEGGEVIPVGDADRQDGPELRVERAQGGPDRPSGPTAAEEMGVTAKNYRHAAPPCPEQRAQMRMPLVSEHQ